MVKIIGRTFAEVTGDDWTIFSSYLGAVGAFFSGSNTVSNLTFGSVQLSTAETTGLSVALILALQSVGGAMGNMVCINNIVAVSSVLNIQNQEGTIIKMGDYFTAFGWGHAIWSDALLSFAMIAFEFMLGVCVLLGVHRRLSTLGILIFMAIMTPVTLYLALYNPVPDCGCFGDALIITNWQTFYKNIILSAAAIIAHRDSIGGYTSVEQLKDVKGIGPAKYAELEKQVTL